MMWERLEKGQCQRFFNTFERSAAMPSPPQKLRSY